jgi:hypothetical protein
MSTTISGISTARTSYLTRPSVIIGAALSLRLIWSACVPVGLVSDSWLYDAFAKSIVAGHGYAFPDGRMTEFWPVGTSATYALLYWAIGSQPWVIPVFQAFLGAVIVGLTWRLANNAINQRVAAIAAWLTACWPILIEFTTILASELLFITLILFSLNIWISRSLSVSLRSIAWGASIAAATYVRPTALPLLFLFPIFQWITDKNWRTLILSFLLSATTAAFLFAPWAYRSFVLFDRMVIVSANGGSNLWMGNNPHSTGGYMPLPDSNTSNEVEADHYYGQEAFKFILANPHTYATLSIRRAVITYSRETIGIVWNEKGLSSKYDNTTLMKLKEISTIYWWVLLVSGSIGLGILILKRFVTSLWPTVVAFVYFAAFPILTIGMDRYHLPIDPLLAIFAAYAIFASRYQKDEM